MDKKDVINIITTAIVLTVAITCMIIIIVYGNCITSKLTDLENDVKKRPTIEYHYHEEEMPKLKGSK